MGRFDKSWLVLAGISDAVASAGNRLEKTRINTGSGKFFSDMSNVGAHQCRLACVRTKAPNVDKQVLRGHRCAGAFGQIPD